MGGRHKNFEDPRLEGQGKMACKIPILAGFLKRPVVILTNHRDRNYELHTHTQSNCRSPPVCKALGPER